jgi:hypothetical protein
MTWKASCTRPMMIRFAVNSRRPLLELDQAQGSIDLCEHAPRSRISLNLADLADLADETRSERLTWVVIG